MKQPYSASSSMMRCALYTMAASLRRFRMTRVSCASSSSSSSAKAATLPISKPWNASLVSGHFALTTCHDMPLWKTALDITSR